MGAGVVSPDADPRLGSPSAPARSLVRQPAGWSGGIATTLVAEGARVAVASRRARRCLTKRAAAVGGLAPLAAHLAMARRAGAAVEVAVRTASAAFTCWS